MADITQALKDVARASFCGLTGTADAVLALGQELDNLVGLGQNELNKSARQALGDTRNLFCNERPEDLSGNYIQPFTGGQCPGTRYAVTAQLVRDGNPQGSPSTRNGDGPIEYFFGTTDVGGSFARIESADNPSLFTAGSSVEGSVTTYNIIDVSPVDGPDDCGDPNDVVPRPYVENDFTTTPDVTYTPDTGPDITIPVPLVFAPVVVNNDLDLEVPVKATINADVDLNLRINLNTGDITIDNGDNVVGPSPIEDPTVLPDPNAPPGDTPTEEEEIQSSIIGVYVVVVNVGPLGEKREIFSDTPGSNLYGPRLGSISFHVEAKVTEGLAWTEDIDVKYLRQVTYCPVPWGAKSVVVTPLEGVQLLWFPIFGEPERDLALRAAGIA